jgi:hypothetical protein
MVPGVGTAAALGLDAANLARDYKHGEFNGAGASSTPAGADPKVLALQKKLIAAGAKIAADGKMGPRTQAAMKQFPNVKEGNEMNKPQSVAEGIASLRDRLAMIENRQEEELDEYYMGEDGNVYNSLGEQITDEGVLGNIWNGAKNFGRGVMGDRSRSVAGKFTKAGSSTPHNVGAAIKNNPIKTALGATAAGAGLGMTAGGAGGSSTPVGGGGGTSSSKPNAGMAAQDAASAELGQLSLAFAF